jgi:hypothetical protein
MNKLTNCRIGARHAPMMDIPLLVCYRPAHLGSRACFRTKYLPIKLMRLQFVLLCALGLLLFSACSKKKATSSMLGRTAGCTRGCTIMLAYGMCGPNKGLLCERKSLIKTAKA